MQILKTRKDRQREIEQKKLAILAVKLDIWKEIVQMVIMMKEPVWAEEVAEEEAEEEVPELEVIRHATTAVNMVTLQEIVQMATKIMELRRVEVPEEVLLINPAIPVVNMAI